MMIPRRDLKLSDGNLRKMTVEELKARQEAKAPPRMPVALMLESIRSLHNVGCFFRTGDGAGVEHIYLTGFTGTPPRNEIAKVALGAEGVIPWEYERDAVASARKAKSDGYTLVAVEQTVGSTSLYETELPFPCCLVFGHEVEGVTQALLDECDLAVEVPMHGAKESLNVSVCSGVVLFEVRRQFDGKGERGLGTHCS